MPMREYLKDRSAIFKKRVVNPHGLYQNPHTYWSTLFKDFETKIKDIIKQEDTKMARNSVNQQITCFSVPREGFMENVVNNDKLDKKQLRVIAMLLTELEGWPEEKTYADNDPENFRRVDADAIARTLGYKKSDVKCILEELVDLHIIQEGRSKTVKKGHRFTF